MAYEELKQRKMLLESLNNEIYQAIEKGNFPPIQLKDDAFERFSAQLELSQNYTKYLFRTLVNEGYIGAKITGSKQDPFSFVLVHGLTDKGRRLISLLPPDESVEALIESLEELKTQVENSSEEVQHRNRKSESLQGLINALQRTASEVGSTGLGKAIGEALFG